MHVNFPKSYSEEPGLHGRGFRSQKIYSYQNQAVLVWVWGEREHSHDCAQLKSSMDLLSQYLQIHTMYITACKTRYMVYIIVTVSLCLYPHPLYLHVLAIVS